MIRAPKGLIAVFADGDDSQVKRVELPVLAFNRDGESLILDRESGYLVGVSEFEPEEFLAFVGIEDEE